MDRKKLLAPILIRYLFFFINLFFTFRIVSFAGWGIFPLILAGFATRDLVQASRLLKIYIQLNQLG